MVQKEDLLRWRTGLGCTLTSPSDSLALTGRAQNGGGLEGHDMAYRISRHSNISLPGRMQ